MSGDVITWPEWRWEPWRRPSLTHVTFGADRYVDNPGALPKRRPVGFARTPAEVEPLLWEGDDG